MWRIGSSGVRTPDLAHDVPNVRCKRKKATSYETLGCKGVAMGSTSISTKGCRVFVRVDDLDKALWFYRDLLGHSVKSASSKWADLAPPRGLTLTVEDEAPIEFHVDSFEKAADQLEKAGIRVDRKDSHSGKVRDPSGNVIGIRDHRK